MVLKLRHFPEGFEITSQGVNIIHQIMPDVCCDIGQDVKMTYFLE